MPVRRPAAAVAASSVGLTVQPADKYIFNFYSSSQLFKLTILLVSQRVLYIYICWLLAHHHHHHHYGGNHGENN